MAAASSVSTRSTPHAADREPGDRQDQDCGCGGGGLVVVALGGLHLPSSTKPVVTRSRPTCRSVQLADVSGPSHGGESEFGPSVQASPSASDGSFSVWSGSHRRRSTSVKLWPPSTPVMVPHASACLPPNRRLHQAGRS